MNVFSNIWNHPKTSAAGLLIAIVSIASVLTQQGITLGAAGKGTVVTLVTGIATALLGLLAKDPSDGVSAGSSTAKLGVWMLVSVLLMGTMPVIGCTQAQKISVAQEIVTWTPSVVSAAETVGATISLLQPQYAVLIAASTAGFDALAKGLQVAANDYLANPNQTTLALLQTEVVKFQQNVNISLLQVAQIKDANSQRMALAAINALATVVNTIMGLVQSVSTKAQVAAMASQVHVTLAQVRPYLDEPGMERASTRVAGDLALSRVPTLDQFFAFEARAGF